VPAVRDVDVAGVVYRDTAGLAEPSERQHGLGGGTRRQLEDPIVVPVGNVDVVDAIHRDAFRAP
jgi:hypothetical protein